MRNNAFKMSSIDIARLIVLDFTTSTDAFDFSPFQVAKKGSCSKTLMEQCAHKSGEKNVSTGKCAVWRKTGKIDLRPIKTSQEKL